MTGRTHQIRAHLAALGLPLVGDPLYRAPRGHPQEPEGDASITPSPPIVRTVLHALRLTFFHPVTGDEMTLQAPYPADMRAALEWLRSSSVPRRT